MAHESFEDGEIAESINRSFVAVKVDREERPDVDAVYMSVCQAATGGGGWPLTVFLTPDRIPFFIGTYFSKGGRYGRPGLSEILRAIAREWEENPARLMQSGAEIVKAIEGARRERARTDLAPDQQLIRVALEQFTRNFDSRWGGFGRAPKFPAPHNLLFLLRSYLYDRDENALAMAERTLKCMCRGGIFDHIGFGFSRYSTDARWLVPHFEKMLYDNALMTMALLACYQATGDEEYKVAVERTLQYLHREMSSPEGGIYSAQDADSDGEEGKYYTWDPLEIARILGAQDGDAFCRAYDITSAGNFEGKSIPNRIGKESFSEMEAQLEALYRYRLTRFALKTDDKMLTAWNALGICALCRAYRTLGDENYLRRAERAFQYIDDHLTDELGLKISYRDGKASGSGLLDDYAFLAWACLELYAATSTVDYLARAVRLSEDIFDRFADPQGGFFMSPIGDGQLIFRPKEVYDGAMPSGNSVFAWCLVKLAALTGELKWMERADKQLDFLLPYLTQQPTSHAFALTALQEKVYPSSQLVCVVSESDGAREILRRPEGYMRPDLSILIKTPQNAAELGRIASFTKDYWGKPGEPYTFYLCEGWACSEPFYELGELEARLRSAEHRPYK